MIDKHELPDVGEPAIGNGGEFSPGIPSVNAEADRVAHSAYKNLIEPVTHPVQTAEGIGSLGAGLAQYAGIAPGESYKPIIDALARDYAKTYGTSEGFKDALVNDPIRVAMDATLAGGLLGKLGRAGSAGRSARVAVPTTEELFDAAEGHYNAMHGFGVELHPRLPADVATNIETELKTVGYRPRLAPKTFDIIEELRNPENGATLTTQEIEGTRRALNKAAGDPAERDAARRAISHIDDMMANLTPADAAINGHFAPRVAEEAVAARGNYASAKRAEQIEQATNNAELQAASTGSGANIDNATRQKMRQILTNPKKRRGFSQGELDQMEEIVRGSFTGNAARLLGKLAPTGIVSGTLSAGLGHAVGHGVGVPVIGHVAKAVGDATTRRAARRLGEQVRMRSPEARRIGANILPPSALMPRYVLPTQQTGRIANQNGDQQ